MKCPVCGKFEFEEYGDFDICPVCNWEKYGLQNNKPDPVMGSDLFFVCLSWKLCSSLTLCPGIPE